MTRRVVTVLGGGSAFTPALAAAFADAADELPPLELRLWGRDATRLADIARFCSLHTAGRGVAQHCTATVSLREALRGADVVLCQVRIGGFAGRSRDEVFPLAHSLPGDETIGPGGLASAMRSLPEIRELARASVQHAPDAPFVLSSNPLGMLLRGLETVPGLRAFGLCELPERTLQRAAALLGIDAQRLAGDYVGSNHQGAFVALRDDAGRDLLPAVLRQLATQAAPGPFGVDGELMQRHGLLWLPYARLYLHRARSVHTALQRALDRGAELARLSADLHAICAASTDGALPQQLTAREMPWCAMAIVPAIAALFDGRPRRLAVSERNDGHLPWLPGDAIVEKYGSQVPLGQRPTPPAIAADTPQLAPLRTLLGELDAFERAAVAAAEQPELSTVQRCVQSHPHGLPPQTDATQLARDVLAAARLEGTP